LWDNSVTIQIPNVVVCNCGSEQTFPKMTEFEFVAFNSDLVTLGVSEVKWREQITGEIGYMQDIMEHNRTKIDPFDNRLKLYRSLSSGIDDCGVGKSDWDNVGGVGAKPVAMWGHV